jgi:hypothetical protein
MSPPKVDLRCPHCGAPLRAFKMPEEGGWQEPCHWACFNNDCPHYREGWEWMWEQYAVKASYRYRVVDPETGRSSPLAVWSENALVDRIVDEEEELGGLGKK